MCERWCWFLTEWVKQLAGEGSAGSSESQSLRTLRRESEDCESQMEASDMRMKVQRQWHREVHKNAYYKVYVVWSSA